MFKRKKKKTGCETPRFRKPTAPPQYEAPPMPPVAPPKLPSGTVFKCLIKRGTSEKYKEFNPILKLNELAVEYDDNKIIGYKLGDGVTKWSELKYIINLTDIKEFWLYCDGRLCTQTVLDPFVIKDYLGGTKPCSEQ